MAPRSNKASPPTGFPHRAVRFGLAAMVILALASALTTWLVSERMRTISNSQVMVLTATEQLQRESQVLELYTRLVIGTGDQAFARRYAALQPHIKQTLAVLQGSLQLPENRATFESVDRAERAISTIEYRALDLAVSGRRQEAAGALEAEDYRALVRTYRSGLDAISTRARAYVAATQAETDRYLGIILGASLMALLLVGFVWAVLVRPARSWAQQLSDARTRAERATRAKSSFLATMSHEIRTPLNSIIGFADVLLTEGELRPRERRQVELMQTAGSMLLTVVNDILDFSAIEAGKIELSAETFAIESLVDNTVSILKDAAEAKGLELRADIDPTVSRFFLSDEGRLRQILLNLLNNALKFTAAGSVTISVKKLADQGDQERLRFTVTDTGSGIDPERQRRLFKPFSQADASISRTHGGSGLGLSISKRLVEILGGQVGVESEVGRGSSFWFELSLPRSVRPLPEPREKSEAIGGGARILLAEDLPMNQELATAMLKRSGHSVDVASDGAEAVQAVAEQSYDLVLMDIQMPNIDGITATRRIRELGGEAATVPIIAMTANVLPQQVRQYLAAGMNGHVPKPVRQKELDAAIARALGHQWRRPEVAAEAQKIDPVFEEETFLEVQTMLAPEKLKGHVERLAEQAAALAGRDPERDRETIGAEAHKIVSQAGMLGLARLSARARDLEEACRDDGNVDAALRTFKEAAGDIEHVVLPLVA